MDTFPFPPAQSAQNRLRQHLVIGLALLGTVLPALAQNDFEYIVRPGDNPWNITARYLKSINYWPRIQRYNNILEPTAIVPGTRLRMPTAWMRERQVRCT